MLSRTAELLNQVDLMGKHYGYAPRWVLIVALREFRDLRFMDHVTSEMIDRALADGLLYEMGRKNTKGIGYALTAQGQKRLLSALRRERDETAEAA